MATTFTIYIYQGIREKLGQGDFEPIQQDQSLQSLYSLKSLANQRREKNMQQHTNRQTNTTNARLNFEQKKF